LPDPTTSGLEADPRVFSLLGAALLWSRFADDLELIHEPCLILRAR